MATGSTARKPAGNQVAYLSKKITFASVATHSITRHKMGTIPAGSKILSCYGSVTTGFSAAGTRVMTVGTNGTTANNILTTIAEETVTGAESILGVKLAFTADTDVFIKLTTAGTAAAAGAVTFTLTYVPPEENII